MHEWLRSDPKDFFHRNCKFWRTRVGEYLEKESLVRLLTYFSKPFTVSIGLTAVHLQNLAVSLLKLSASLWSDYCNLDQLIIYL